MSVCRKNVMAIQYATRFNFTFAEALTLFPMFLLMEQLHELQDFPLVCPQVYFSILETTTQVILSECTRFWRQIYLSAT
jgi:hypothetical protein